MNDRASQILVGPKRWGACVQALKRSCWWVGHPSGPVAAPAYANHLTVLEGEFAVPYGANYFMVERALRNGLENIPAPMATSLLESALAEQQFRDVLTLTFGMVLSVKGATPTLPPMELHAKKWFWVFGAQGVLISAFYAFVAELIARADCST